MKHLIEQWIFFPLLGLLIVLIAVTSPIFASESNIYNPESLIVCTNAIDARESAKVMTLIGECTKVNGRPIEMISEVDHGYNHIGTWAVFEIRGVGEENVFYSPSYKSFNGRWTSTLGLKLLTLAAYWYRLSFFYPQFIPRNPWHLKRLSI